MSPSLKLNWGFTVFEIKNLSISFGGISVLKNINLTIDKGDRIGISGGNGSGKSTLINAATGFVSSSLGNFYFNNHKTSNLPPWEIHQLGISRTFQNARFQKSVILIEQITLDASKKKYALELCSETGIMQYLHKFPTDVPFQVLKIFEVVRALTVSPQILFLDEPSAGLTNSELIEMSKFIKNRLPTNSSLILVEHREEMMNLLTSRTFKLEQGIITQIVD